MNLLNPALENKLRRTLRSSLKTESARKQHLDIALSNPTQPVEYIWQNAKKIGAYSLIKAELSKNKEIQIIAHAQRFHENISAFLRSKQAEKMNLDLIVEWLHQMQKSINQPSRIDASSLKTILLEEIVLRENHKLNSNIGFILLAQIALENFSRIESRIVSIKDFSANEYKFVLLLKKGSSDFIFFQPLNGLIEPARSITGILKNVSVVPQSISFGKERKIALFNSQGNEITFQISGRTPAENRFAREAQTIAAAHEDDLVPFEVLFHPFWRRYGHTTLRIGESLYEFSSDGWRAHNSGADSARGYIFNNPFFKSRLAVFSPSGMPPVSYGVSRLEKASIVRDLQKMLDDKSAYRGKDREKFNLFLNNCNQKLRGAFREAGMKGFEERGYMDFSSVLCFNSFLNSEKFQEQTYFIYPLPNTEINESNLRDWMPRILYLENNARMELRRAAKSVLVDIALGIVGIVNKVTQGLFRFKICNRLTDIQHINDQWL